MSEIVITYYSNMLEHICFLARHELKMRYIEGKVKNYLFISSGCMGTTHWVYPVNLHGGVYYYSLKKHEHIRNDNYFY